MRIAFIQETFNPFFGGSQRRTYEIARRLADRGFDVHVFTVKLDPRWKSMECIDGIQVHRIVNCPDYMPSSDRRKLSAALSFAIKSFLTSRFDVIDINHCPLFPALFRKFRRDSKLILTVHEVWDECWTQYMNGGHFPILFACLGRVLEKATYFGYETIAVSETVAKRLSRFVWVRNIYVVPNGIDYRGLSKYRKNKKEDYAIYVGRLNRHKRVDLLLYVWEDLVSDYPLKIVGSGPEMARLIHLKKKLNLRDVEFLGSVSDHEKYELLSNARINILPSYREGQGITVLEGWAVGTPAIVTNDGAMNHAPYLVKKMGAGLAVSVRGLSEAIRMMFEDDEKYRRFQSNTENVRIYDWEIILQKYLNVLEALE